MEEITHLSSELATPFDFVSEVDTSMFGDHVWDVKKDTLYFGNFNKIRGFIDNLHDFYKLPGESALPSRDSKLEIHLEALRSAGGRLLDDFLPGVVYKEVPEVVEEIEKTGEMIANMLGPCLKANEHDFFENEIKKARDCLTGLLVSEKIRDTKPIKLEGFLGIKDKVKDLVTLFELLHL